jgi:hypothetical protein
MRVHICPISFVSVTVLNIEYRNNCSCYSVSFISKIIIIPHKESNKKVLYFISPRASVQRMGKLESYTFQIPCMFVIRRNKMEARYIPHGYSVSVAKVSYCAATYESSINVRCLLFVKFILK